MCAYFSKAEDHTFEVMKQAAKDLFDKNVSELKRSYNCQTECPVNKAVYSIMPELRFKKTFPRVIFLNSNMPEKWFRMFWEKEEISELPNESTDIFQSNMLDFDLDRPNAKVWKCKIWYFCKFMLW